GIIGGVRAAIAQDCPMQWRPLFPGPRELPGMVYDSGRNVSVLFGQLSSGNAFSMATWEWNGSAWSWRASAGPAAPRYDPAMVFDKQRGVTVLFGGYWEAA